MNDTLKKYFDNIVPAATDQIDEKNRYGLFINTLINELGALRKNDNIDFVDRRRREIILILQTALKDKTWCPTKFRFKKVSLFIKHLRNKVNIYKQGAVSSDRNQSKKKRITNCWNCKEENLDSFTDYICGDCGWICCSNCGACKKGGCE